MFSCAFSITNSIFHFLFTNSMWKWTYFLPKLSGLLQQSYHRRLLPSLQPWSKAHQPRIQDKGLCLNKISNLLCSVTWIYGIVLDVITWRVFLWHIHIYKRTMHKFCLHLPQFHSWMRGWFSCLAKWQIPNVLIYLFKHKCDHHHNI